jgi:hypothetical protein
MIKPTQFSFYADCFQNCQKNFSDLRKDLRCFWMGMAKIPCCFCRMTNYCAPSMILKTSAYLEGHNSFVEVQKACHNY